MNELKREYWQSYSLMDMIDQGATVGIIDYGRDPRLHMAYSPDLKLTSMGI